MENKKFWDKSTKILIISNIITIIFALLEGWDLNNVLWIYWFQSLIIGYFNYKRILKLENFTTENLRMNDQPVSPTENSKKQIANFFLMHYGLFHLGYLLFLMSNFSFSFKGSYLGFSFIIAILSFVASIITFYFNHKTSFEFNYQEDLKSKINIGTLMFIPYARIIPMHLIIIFAGNLASSNINISVNGVMFPIFSTFTILFFLSLKTIADVIMHKVEHNYLRRNITEINTEMVIKN